MFEAPSPMKGSAPSRARYMAPELFDCKTKITEKIDVRGSVKLSEWTTKRWAGDQVVLLRSLFMCSF